MSLPLSRNRTYIAGVTKVAAQDMNDIQDLLIQHSTVRGTLVRDNFTGQSPDAGIWKTPTGSVTIVDDSANGGSGAARFDGTGSTAELKTQPLVLGTGDFTASARLRISGAVGAASGASFGIDGPGGSQTVRFRIQGSISTTNWLVWIDSSGGISGNGTPVLISSSYANFEVKRKSNIVTFSIDGVILHTESPYISSMDSAFLQLVTNNCIMLCDSVELITAAF